MINELNWQFYTYKTFLVVVRVTAHISHEAEEYDEECLGESHDEDEKDGSESCEVLHHHAVDHGDHGADQLDAAAEEEEVESVAEHADDGEDVLHVSEAEHPRRHHQQHRDAPQQEDHPGNDGSIDNADICLSIVLQIMCIHQMCIYWHSPHCIIGMLMKLIFNRIEKVLLLSSSFIDNTTLHCKEDRVVNKFSHLEGHIFMLSDQIFLPRKVRSWPALTRYRRDQTTSTISIPSRACFCTVS